MLMELSMKIVLTTFCRYSKTYFRNIPNDGLDSQYFLFYLIKNFLDHFLLVITVMEISGERLQTTYCEQHDLHVLDI